MADFAKLAATAKRLIEKNGRPIDLYRRSTTPADPLKPWRGTELTATGGALQGVRAAVVPAAGSGFGRTRTNDTTRDSARDQVALIAASSIPAGVDLEVFTEIVDGGRSWRIGEVWKLQPADIPLVFVVEFST